MTYNPATSDRSAEILTNANNQAAAIQLQGMQNLGDSIAALGKSYADGITKAHENSAKANTNLGTGEAISSIYKTYGTPEQYQDYIAGLDRNANNQDKLAGYNAMHIQTADALMKMAQVKAQYTALGNAYAQKQAVRGTSNPALSVEVADGIDIWQ